jgi:hypothetical protein
VLVALSGRPILLRLDLLFEVAWFLRRHRERVAR